MRRKTSPTTIAHRNIKGATGRRPPRVSKVGTPPAKGAETSHGATVRNVPGTRSEARRSVTLDNLDPWPCVTRMLGYYVCRQHGAHGHDSGVPVSRLQLLSHSSTATATMTLLPHVRRSRRPGGLRPAAHVPRRRLRLMRLPNLSKLHVHPCHYGAVVHPA